MKFHLAHILYQKKAKLWIQDKSEGVLWGGTFLVGLWILSDLMYSRLFEKCGRRIILLFNYFS